MEYKYTSHIDNPNERIKIIAEEILSEYPNLGSLAYKAAN